MRMVFAECSGEEQKFLQERLSDHELFFIPDPLTTENLPSDIEIISTHTNSKIDQFIIDHSPHLQLIATRTTGFDHIDLKAAAKRAIVVCNVPNYGEVTVAEFAFGLILTLSRKIYQSISYVKEKKEFNTHLLEGFDLAGKTIGVIGTGKIGQHLIKMAHGFSLQVIAYDAYPNESLTEMLNFQYVSLDELLKNSDIISLHLPATTATKHTLNSFAFEKMKKGVILINTARGSVIDTKALLDALDKGIIGAAALDVLEIESFTEKEVTTPEIQEMIIMNNQLLTKENVVITPHNAFNTKEAKQRILQTTVTNIQAYMQGHPQNTVPLPELSLQL